MATAAFNNYCPVSLLAVGPLFQQSGFSLPLDRDQVRQHNTPLCLEMERKRKEERTASIGAFVCTPICNKTRMYVLVVQMLHVYVHVCVIGVSSFLSCAELQSYIITATAFCCYPLWDTWHYFPTPQAMFAWGCWTAQRGQWTRCNTHQRQAKTIQEKRHCLYEYDDDKGTRGETRWGLL